MPYSYFNTLKVPLKSYAIFKLIYINLQTT